LSDDNIDTLVLVLECFHRASGMRININKSKIMGISVEEDKIDKAASKIRCLTLKSPFSYLGSKVGGLMLTLLKSVLGSMPIYHMSIFKVSMRVLQCLESIRSHFFNGNDLHGKKMSWVKWKNVLASKEKGGVGVSSLYALNRGLLMKWVWRFITQSSSLWARVIKAIHGEDGNLRKNARSKHSSIWLDIVHEMKTLKNKGIDVLNCMKIKLGNGENTMFWDDIWCGDTALKQLYPRLPRGGAEEDQFLQMVSQIEGVMLTNSRDRWTWTLEGSGNFSVASVRNLIDEKSLPELAVKTR
ncbi:hypothetical protein Tco_0432521, partial [Tanacetum coccineum]